MAEGSDDLAAARTFAQSQDRLVGLVSRTDKLECVLQRTPVLMDRLRALLALSSGDPEGSTDARGLDDATSGIVFRWRTSNRLERLFPIGLCALLVFAVLASSLPSATSVAAVSATQPPSAAVPGSPGGPRMAYGAGDGPNAPDVTDMYLGDGSIANTMQNRAAGSDVRSLLTSYTVKSGDTIAKIASSFGLASTTIYWANKASIPDPSKLHVGQILVIPPMDGLIIKVGAKDTLESLAKRFAIDAQDIIDTNNLPEASVVLGESIIIPGASGGPIPKPKVSKPTTGGGGRSAPAGRWPWPLKGDFYVSQYFWSGHHAIDIATSYGSGVYAAAGGTVVYAGWRSYVGGGNVIWVREGPKLYTTYNHLSYVGVHVGQVISVGQLIGRVGTSGVTTGPHLHFEVWLGYPWELGNNSDAINPCRYLAGC